MNWNDLANRSTTYVDLLQEERILCLKLASRKLGTCY